MARVQRRRLISFTGYKGFISQLQPGEYLVIEYEHEEKGTRIEIITNENTFAKIEAIDGTDLYGIWAWRFSDKPARYIDPRSVYTDDYDNKTSVRRPVEDLVFSAVIKGCPAVDLLRGTPWEKLPHVSRTR